VFDNSLLPLKFKLLGFHCVCVRVCVFFFLIIYSACSITVSNTTCIVDILHNYLSSNFSYIFYIQICRLNCGLLFFLYSLSRDRLSMDFLKFLQYLLISISLLTGQFSDRSTAALSMSRSCSTSSQLNSIWSIVCVCVCFAQIHE